MYVKYRIYDGLGFKHLDHRPDDITVRGDQSHINPWESTMLIPTWEAFEAASEHITWSVIATDNYNRDEHVDDLISTGHLKHEAAKICDDLNAEIDPKGSTFYTLVSTQHRLKLGMLDCM